MTWNPWGNANPQDPVVVAQATPQNGTGVKSENDLFVKREDGSIVDAVERPRARQHAAWADLTTRGNGERIVDAHALDLRHAPAAGWFEWDGKRWAPDPEQKRAMRRALSTLVDMQLHVDPSDREGEKHIRASQSPAAWASALRCAALYPPIATRFEAFDDGAEAPLGHAYRLNVQNGTVELKTGLLHEHRREDSITKLAGASFDPAANQTEWLAFLVKAQPNPEILAFLQRLAGVWLIGDVREEIFPIFWGQGGNGKGTYLDTIRRALGDYAGVIPDDVLVAQHQKPHPTGLMVFRGLRLAVASETDEGETLAIAQMKRLTGGDAIRARFMGKDFIEFEPTHKLVMMTNARPKLRGSVSASLKRRIFFLPWETTITREEIDVELKGRLSSTANLSAVLAWMIEGYRLYEKHGLSPPASVLAATADYIASEDVLGSFVEERCEFAPGFEILASQLYHAYREYLREQGETAPVRPQDFKHAFLAKEGPAKAGATWKRRDDGRFYLGVRLRPLTAEDYAERDHGARGRWSAKPS